MKRNFDLIKEILIFIECTPPIKTSPMKVEIDGFDRDVIQYHLELLKEAGLIDAIVAHDKRIFPNRLTWEGHDFLDSARNKTIWAKTMKIVKEKGGGATFEIVKSLLIAEIKTRVGLTD